MATAVQPVVKPVVMPKAVKAKPYIPPNKPASRPKPTLVQTAKPTAVQKPKKAPRPPHEFPGYDAPVERGFAASPSINPTELWKILDVAPYARIEFASDRDLNNFRQNLYKVNVEGRYRYSTRREGWHGLIVMRLK